MNISRRKQEKALFTGNNSIKILIMVLMKPSRGMFVPNPKINSFRL